MTIGISAFVCSTTWPTEQIRFQRLLKFWVFAFTLATYLYMGPYRKVPANQEEKIMSYMFAALAALMALDLSDLRDWVKFVDNEALIDNDCAVSPRL